MKNAEDIIKKYSEVIKNRKWRSGAEQWHFCKLVMAYEDLKLAEEVKHVTPEFVRQDSLGSYRVTFRDISYELAEALPTISYSSYDYTERTLEVVVSYEKEDTYREMLREVGCDFLKDLHELPEEIEKLYKLWRQAC